MSTKVPDSDQQLRFDEVARRFRRPSSVPEIQRIIGINDHSNEKFIDLAQYLVATVPPGRELALALTKLQEAKFFVNEARIQDGVVV